MNMQPSLKNVVIISMVLTFLILGGMVVSGFYYVWYRNTGYREQNLPSFKPQEAAYSSAPAGTISMAGKEPVVDTPFQGSLLSNPVPATADSVGKGEELFLTYCEPCHGKTGNGQGIMGTVPALALIPEKQEIGYRHYLSGYMSATPGIDINFVQHQSDGEIFYTITNGGESIMPSFKDALNPEQRWHLINFIKIRLGEAGGE